MSQERQQVRRQASLASTSSKGRVISRQGSSLSPDGKQDPAKLGRLNRQGSSLIDRQDSSEGPPDLKGRDERNGAQGRANRRKTASTMNAEEI